MKHATPAALDRLGDLLTAIRKYDTLREKQRGVFYRQSRAFLHFHEDPAGLFADVRLSEEFDRFPVNTAAERSSLLKRIETTLNAERATTTEREAGPSNRARTRR
jgi:hypothetical protein